MDVRPEIKLFAEVMEKQLQKNEHKGGWKDCESSFLKQELFKNSRELSITEIHFPYDKQTILRRAANIANFAMMIADVCGALGESGTGEEEFDEEEILVISG